MTTRLIFWVLFTLAACGTLTALLASFKGSPGGGTNYSPLFAILFGIAAFASLKAATAQKDGP